MTNLANPNELPPGLAKRSNRLVFLRIGLVLTFVVFIVAKVWQHENTSKLPVTQFLISGETGATFSFTATASTGESFNVTTGLYRQEQKVFSTARYEISSGKLERVGGAGALSLQIIVGTNQPVTVELAKDKRVVEFKKDSWTYK